MESDIGNIRAIREWTRRYFYTKQDINYFMTKIDEGLKGYALMIIGPRNKKVTINPGNYQFTLNSDGWYRYLFFFNRNQEITLSVQDGITMNYQLDAYNDTICLSPWVIATPQMTSYCRPSGFISGTNSNNGYQNAFDRNDNSYSEDRMSSSADRYITYEFPEEIVIYKAEVKLSKVYGSTPGYSVALQGSHDGINWENLYYNEEPVTYNKTIYIDDPKPFLYYRYYLTDIVGAYIYFYEIKYYTIDQSTTVYQNPIPVLTSNNGSNGIASASSVDGSAEAWRPFDRNEGTTGWIAYKSFSEQSPWIQYHFTDSAKCIKKVAVWSNNRAKEFKFQASNDGNTWVDLAICTLRHTDQYYYQPFMINNSNYYTYYRLTVTTPTNESRCGFQRIDMYEEV